MLNFFPDFLFAKKEESNSPKELFEKIVQKELKTKDIELYSQINDSTIKISLYFEDSIQKFPSLFENNLKTFDDCLTHLEKIAVPNKCICAGIIDNIPGWRCIDCTKFENGIYCNDCYLNSKDWHKDHKVVYLPSSTGMCDCGDPNTLNKYCREHSGPFLKKEEIEDYIQKTFGKKVTENLRKFFDDFFVEFSKYLILTEKCDLFIQDLFDEKFHEPLTDELTNEKEDVILLKSNFNLVFKNLLYFLRLITKKNVGMLHLIADYLLKNNFDTIKLEEKYMTDHRCIEISQNDIKIYYDNMKKEKHICKCPFLRHIIANYRDDFKLNSEEEEKEFLFSFVHNLKLRFAFSVLNFFLYKQILNNNNEIIIYSRTQFYLEDAQELIATKTSFIEESADLYFKMIERLLKKDYDNNNVPDNTILKKIFTYIVNFEDDSIFYTKTKMRELMTEKTTYIKRCIDLFCLFQNYYEYASIVPHPPFISKSINYTLLGTEKILTKMPGFFNCFFDWKNIEKLKEIYKYIIYKILNQEKEGIKQLKENEFSFFLTLYRSFGILMNSFCFNYSFLNNCSIIESINFFKNNFFESQEQIDAFVDIILKDYFKLFGFISGTKNNFFNYYDKGEIHFPIYTKFTFYKQDFTLLKYLFVLSSKKIDINTYLKFSNIENVYSKFNDIFNLGKIIEENNTNLEEAKKEPEPNPQVETFNININNINFDQMPREQVENMLLRFLRGANQKQNDKTQDEFNIIMQWETLLGFLICLLKDDSSNYWSLISNYEDLYSSKTKRDLFNDIKSNEDVIKDLKNILQEKIIHNILMEGNWINKKNLEKNIDKYLLIIFSEDNIYNQILEELTHNKMNEQTKIFYLKDKYLKYLDCNYYINSKDKSSAQEYILNFKKDAIKTYNYHYYNPSKLTFDFFEMVYEKVFLDKDNLDLIIKIVEKLINEDKIMLYSDKKSIRNSLLPIILNYLLMFSVINTKSFIEFKLANKKEINTLQKILNNFIKNAEKNNAIDKDLESYIKEVLHKMNQYQILFDIYNGDLSKLDKYDYNTDISEHLRKNQNLDIKNLKQISEDLEIVDEGKQKSKKAKERLKLLMQKKSNGFMKKIEQNEEMKKAIDEGINDMEKIKNNDDEIMCFYCRNAIKLNSFEQPYGKLGLNIEDLFFINSIKATLREEFSKLKLNDKVDDEIMNTIKPQKFNRIIYSCGHYFHNSCFIEGCKKKNSFFVCPLCLKPQNVLIPPLTLFHDKYSFLKSGNFADLLEEKEEKKESNDNIDIFYATVITFLSSINVFKEEIKNYSTFLDGLFTFYQAYFNSFENIFYAEGTTFHKLQQVDNIKNLILSLRLILNNSQDSKKIEVIKFIKETIFKLTKGPQEKIFLYQYNDSYMHYFNLFQKIILSLEILFDYQEIKKSFKYIIYIFLPYLCFGLYLKKIIIEKENNKLNKEQLKQNLNLNDFKKYLKEENKLLMENLNSFLKRFCFIKLISDYENKNENIINSFNSFSFANILQIIDMDDLIKLLPQNEITIDDIIDKLPKIFNPNDIFYKLFSSSLNFDNVLNSILENVKDSINNDQNLNYEITKELMIQFAPIKFNFIRLDSNIFDFIENNIGKKCSLCKNIRRDSFLCLICGEKVCNHKKSDEYMIHVRKCTGDFCIFIQLSKTKLFLANKYGDLVKLFHLYVNKAGTGPKGNQISNEFNLSEEKIKNIIKNYISNDFHFK